MRQIYIPAREVPEGKRLRKTDRRSYVKLCSKCNNCWEYTGEKKNKKKVWEYLENFPKLGKPLKVCPDCKVGCNA